MSTSKSSIMSTRGRMGARLGRWLVLLAIVAAVPFARGQQVPLGDPLRLGQPPSQSEQPQAPSTPFWGSGSSAFDLPAADIRAVAPSRAQATAARWAYWNAQDKLNDLVREQVLAFEESPQYLAAVAAENSAYRAYLSARERALAPLRENPSYLASIRIHEDLSRQLDELRALPRDEVDQARVAAIARVKLQVLEDNRRLEDDALTRDQQFQAARKHWQDAAAETASMRASFLRSIRNNEELKSVRQQIADLRVARHATQAFHESTVRAANIAINYAYWSRYQDRYT